MDKVSVTDPQRRVAGDTAAALLAQPAVAVKQETKQACYHLVPSPPPLARHILNTVIVIKPTLILR